MSSRIDQCGTTDLLTAPGQCFCVEVPNGKLQAVGQDFYTCGAVGANGFTMR